MPPGRYQCQTLLERPSTRAGQQLRVVLGQMPLLHAAGEERAPGELEVAGARPRDLARGLLARRRAVDSDQALLRHQDAVALHFLLGQVERVDEQLDERLVPVVVWRP